MILIRIATILQIFITRHQSPIVATIRYPTGFRQRIRSGTPIATTSQMTIVSTVKMIAHPPVIHAIVARTVAVTAAVPAGILVSFGDVTISEIDVAGQGYRRPILVDEDATVPSPALAIYGTFEEGGFEGVAGGAGLLEGCGAGVAGWEYGEGGVAGVVVVAGAECFFVVQEGRTGVIAALLAIWGEGRLGVGGGGYEADYGRY